MALLFRFALRRFFFVALGVSGGATATHAPLTLLTSPLAKCMDGTPGGYYFEAATRKESATKWVLWLEGGGECTTHEDCQLRLNTSLGSSKFFKPTEELYHHASSDATENPLASTWNRVMLKYCSQDLHSGTRTVASEDTYNFFFSGHLIFQEMVADLKAHQKFDDATEIALGGDSAGGIGTWINVGWLRDAVSPGARVVAAPIAGFYSFAYPYMGSDRTPVGLADFREGAWPQHVALWQSHYDANCAKALGADAWACMLSNYSRPYIKVDAFVVEAQTDKVQLQAHDNIPEPPWSELAKSYVQEWHLNMTSALHRLPPKDGFFSPACYIHTAFGKGAPLLLDAAIGHHLNYGQAFASWYAGAPTRLEDTCGVLCGHCAGESNKFQERLSHDGGGTVVIV